MKIIELLPKKESRIVKGCPWIWKGEIKTPLNKLKPAEIVKVYDSKGRFLGIGYANPHSLITIRLLSYQDVEITQEFIQEKVEKAFRLRKALYPDEECFRVVFSESDFLPGLIVDKFCKMVVFQITTAGMEAMREWVLKALENALSPEIIVERSDSPIRRKERLEPVKRIVKGEVRDGISVKINDINFLIHPLEGQKTGFFLDQRENYLLLKGISSGKRILDAFCNNGAFGLHALRFGAREVVFLDSSEKALHFTRKNLALNSIMDNYSIMEADALKELKKMEQRSERFDLIILDPPAFIKDRKKLKEGMKGYKEINLRAMKMLNNNGFLITSSCSHLLSKENFIKILEESAFDSRRIIKIIEFRTQPRDHPFLLGLPESNYLKCALIQVIYR